MVNNPVFYAVRMTLWLVALPGFQNISCVPGNFMFLVMTPAHILLILGSVEAILIAQWAQWIPDCKIWNHSTSMCTGRSGIRGYSAEVSGVFKYEVHIKAIVLHYWCSLRCIKSWIVISYRGLKFPHTAVVLLVLESDGACTSFNGHCARKCIVLVLVWCYKARGESEKDLWRYWLHEDCIKQWYDKPSGYGCLSKKCELW